MTRLGGLRPDAGRVVAAARAVAPGVVAVGGEGGAVRVEQLEHVAVVVGDQREVGGAGRGRRRAVDAAVGRALLVVEVVDAPGGRALRRREPEQGEPVVGEVGRRGRARPVDGALRALPGGVVGVARVGRWWPRSGSGSCARSRSWRRSSRRCTGSAFGVPRRALAGAPGVRRGPSRRPVVVAAVVELREAVGVAS